MRLRPLSLAMASSVLLLAGCASTGGLTPTAKVMNAGNLSATRALAGVQRATSAWPQAQWWKTLDDPQLDQLIDEALADNPTMTLVAARVRAALAAAGVANAQRKPTVTAGASVSGARVPPIMPPLADGHFGVIRYGYLHFTWDFDIWGGKRDAWEAAVGTARATEVDAQGARLKLSADVAQAYFQLAAGYVLRDLAQEELGRAQTFLKLTRKRVQSGIDNRLPLEQIESETASDRAHLKAANNAVRTQALVLAALLGKGPDRALAIKRPTLASIPALTLPPRLPVELLSRRPDLVAARWRVQAAGKHIKAAKTKFLPNLSISALAGLIAPSSMNLFSLRNRFYEIAPALGMPIFEGGRLRANLASKDAARDVAVAHYNQTLVHAVNQVATQADDLRSLASQVGDAQAARASAQHAYKLAKERFKAGIGNFLEALTERKELIAAERQLAGMKVARVQAWVRLNEALGGGFDASDAPAIARMQQAHTSAVSANH